MNPPWTVHEYRLEDFPFSKVVAEALYVDDLADLAMDMLPRRTWQTDQESPWHELFYSRFDLLWRSLFERFVHEVVAPLVSEPCYYQAKPTFRVHLPGNVAVGEFHTDAQYHHPQGETSWWVPLTPAFESCSVWIAGDGGYCAPSLVPGQMIVFDAVNRRHGNLVNETGQARVSFDFRTLPVRLLPAVEGPPTKHSKLRFVPGGYYAIETVTP